MKKLRNTLFVLSEDAYLTLDGENVVVNREKQAVARYPLHTLTTILSFSYAGASPALMGACAEREIGLSFCSPRGKFLARVANQSNGNVLLRRTQYRVADDPLQSCQIARAMVLGKLYKGENELCLVRRFRQDTNLEAVYLLGDFGVSVAGRLAWITEPVRELTFGSWTVQGLPFYGGNVTYHVEVESGVAKQSIEDAFDSTADIFLEIEISKFAAPLIRVDTEGQKVGIIAFSPYRLRSVPAETGKVRLDITAYGSRINTFGALHNCDEPDHKATPEYWRTQGCAWSYEYCLRPAGILKAPEISYCREKVQKESL